MRVLVAEDQFLLRQGLVALLTAHGVRVCAEVAIGPEIADAVRATEPDLALLDIRMPPTNTDEGVRAALALRRGRPGFPVVLLSQYVEHVYLGELLDDQAGAVGYLLKDRVFEAAGFVDALHTVAAGGTAVDPDVIATLMAKRRHADAMARLTAREREVLALMAQGDSNAQIAQRLVVTEKAVEKHIGNLLAKLDLPPTTAASRRVLAVLAHLQGRPVRPSRP